jgi:hypothetical protein
MFSGQVTVTTPGTAVEVIDSDLSAFVITIKAFADNTGNIYVGDEDVDSDTGFILDAGEEVTLFINNKTNTLYIDAGTGSDGVSYIGWADRGILTKDNE